MTASARLKIANYVVFQLGWLACVWGASAGYPWLSLVAIVPALAFHFAVAREPVQEMKLLASCLVIGIVFDALLLATQWVSFPNGQWIPGLAPYWMAILWLFFGSTLNLSMDWMKGRPVAAFLLGAIGGPLAYLAGQRLGGIDLVQPTPALIALALGWGLVMILLIDLARRLDGFSGPHLPDFLITDPKHGVLQND